MSNLNASEKKICLLSDHHICVNPRLWKEAFFYEKSGYEVVILNMWQSEYFLSLDNELLKGHKIIYKCYLNMIPGQAGLFKRFYYRVRKNLAGKLQKYAHVTTPWAISYAPEKMYSYAIKEDAALYIAHLECAFYAGKKLIEAGRKVSFDFEDWYSRDYLVPERPVKLLASLEHFALHHAVFCTAASKAMARALKATYKSPIEITVVYNGFSSQTDKNIYHNTGQKNNENNPVKLLWFSRTIGPERGLEYLLKALNTCKQPLELHVLGKMAEGYEEFLLNEFSQMPQHTIIMHPFIPHDQLPEFIEQFTIGLAIEENINDNKNLTISNKLLQYLQAGLPVIASDTEGQREVAAYFGENISIVNITDTILFKEAIEKLIENHSIDKKEQVEIFENIFSWEAQEKKLQQLLKII